MSTSTRGSGPDKRRSASNMYTEPGQKQGNPSHGRGTLPVLIMLVLLLIAGLSHCGTKDEPVPPEPLEEETEVKEPVEPGVEPVVDYVEDSYLYGMEYLRDGGVTWSDEDAVANTGETYENRMWSEAAYRELVFHLNKQYDTFSGVWYICKGNKDDMDRNRMELYADDQLVYSSKALTAGDLPEEIEVDITGCNVLTILFCEGTGAGELGNARVWNKTPRPLSDEVHDPGKLPIWLTELDELMVSDVEISNKVTEYNTGDSVSHTLLGYHGGEIIYYLRGEYSRLTGMWGINNVGGEECRAKIYADGELVYKTGDLEEGDLPEEFDVNIKGCEKLSFQFEGIDAGEHCYSWSTKFANLRLHP